MSLDIEKALDTNIIPWKNIVHRCSDFWIFDDHGLVFAPTLRKHDNLIAAYKGAYLWGVVGVQNGKWSGFKIEQTVGLTQTVEYPHIIMMSDKHLTT